jgi:hypothetical protein
MALAGTEFLEERIASIIRVTRIGGIVHSQMPRKLQILNISLIHVALLS